MSPSGKGESAFPGHALAQRPATRCGNPLMNDLFDYRTIAVAFALKCFLQAVVLLYVWYVDRKYPPARKWAVGSLLLAAGTLLIAQHLDTSSAAIIIGRNILIYAGLITFGVGIIEACAAPVPWRFFGALVIASLLAQWWFTVEMPSIPARAGMFSLSLALGASYVAVCALGSPPGPLRGTRRLIGVLLTIQVVASLFCCVASFQPHFASVFRTSIAQNGFILVSVGASFLLALALTVLTGQRTTALLAAILDNLDHGVAMFDADKRLVICNDRYGELYGVETCQLRPGTTLPSIIARRIANGLFAGGSAQHYFEERMSPVVDASTELHHLNDGRSIVISRRPMQFGGWLTTHADVSAIQRIEAQVAYLAHHDPLTGIANRQLFGERMREEIGRLGQDGEGFAVLLIDLDRFKAINDTLGHPSGDALLVAVAERLRSCVAEADIVARLGGDEFAIVQMTGAGRDTTLHLAKRLLDTVGAAYELEGQKVMVGASIGIAKAPENGTDADQLMRNADLALYRSKAEGRNCYRFYDQDMDANVRARHALELALRNSIMCDDFLLEYQPVVDVVRNEICAAEALVRWRHPSGNVVEPAKFIGIAEETGLIVPLGEWILRQACSDALAWPKHSRVSVNLSVAQFTNGNICDSVEAVLQETGLPPTRLELEVTELILLQSSDTVLSRLHRLKELGVSIVLDDFGTGYSSLNYLTKFPFDRLKIDKSFIVDLGYRKECSAIVAAIIGVARSLGMAVTAEGVETVEQYELLRAAGCAQMQGFLFGRPGPVEDLAFTRCEPAARHVAQRCAGASFGTAL